MKKILLLIVLLSIINISFSQSVSLLSNKIDEFTKAHIIQTNPWESEKPTNSDQIDKNGALYASMSYTKAEDNSECYAISFFILTFTDLGCLSEKDGKAILLFENGITITIKQFSETNCSKDGKMKSYSAQYALLDEEQDRLPNWGELQRGNFNRLLSMPVKKIRIYTTTGYYDFELKEEKKWIFSEHATIIKKYL